MVGKIGDVAWMAVSEAYCGSTSEVVVEEGRTTGVDYVDSIAGRAPIQVFATLVFVSAFLVFESFKKILDLVLRCLAVYGANVNVKEYAYRCGTPGRNQDSRYRRR